MIGAPSADEFDWSLPSRVARRALAAFGNRFDRPGADQPVVDGRVLNPTLRAMLSIGEKTKQNLRKDDVDDARKSLNRLSVLGCPTLRTVQASQRMIPGPESDLAVRVYRPLGMTDPLPVIVFYHGGGWVTGNLRSHDGPCRIVASVAKCVVVAVDYRLAPEHPFPAGLDDAVAAFRLVRDQTVDFGGIPGRVGVMGDSAGGNLAAAVSLACRDDAEGAPIAQGLIYPAVEMSFSSHSHTSMGAGYGLDHEAMLWFRERYLPNPTDYSDVRVAPLLADDHSGLAPALIITAGFDPLRDEGRQYADVLAAAGVSVKYRCYDDMMHGFFNMGILPGGIERISEIAADMGRLMSAD